MSNHLVCKEYQLAISERQKKEDIVSADHEAVEKFIDESFIADENLISNTSITLKNISVLVYCQKKMLSTADETVELGC